MARLIAVSGAASGIGAALAAQLRDQGDEVIGIDLEGAEVKADLSTPDGRAEAVRGVLERTGGTLDAVVACAGVSGPRTSTVTVNYFGATALLEGLRPALARADAPRAAVVGSINGIADGSAEIVEACLAGEEDRAVRLADGLVADGRGGLIYPSSKRAVAHWLRRTCVADGWANAGIPLNGVAPGVVKTPMTQDLFASEEMRKIMDEAVPMPLNGHAEPETVAHALRWLIGVENSHVTGQMLYVDGGAEVTLRGPDHV